MMNEEILRREFKKWAMESLFGMFGDSFDRLPLGVYRDYNVQRSWLTWLESARRTNRKARTKFAKQH